MPNYDFQKDFPIARQTEIEVAGLLEQTYQAEILGFENTNKYDILTRIKDKEYTFEVKEDFACEKTGNVVVEFSCRGKPSGIEASEANFYIYKIHTSFGIYIYILKTSELKKMIEEKQYFRIVNGGDEGSNSMNYLFKYETFIRNAKLLPFAP